MLAAPWADIGASDTQIAERPEPSVRTIRVGLVGLGQVGQAVARLVPTTARLRETGLRFRVTGALVRDVDRPRRCPRPARLTTNPGAFLRGNYDVVIEALGVVEPARTIVARLLGRGVAVVTANKALVAAHGAELAALAARRGTSLRYEASALAGIPFLGALAARPLVSDVTQFTAIVNGTSNFMLTALEADRCSFDAALERARELGLAEPDPSRDLDGLDAADKLLLLATLFGWGAPVDGVLDVQGIRGLTHADAEAARRLGGTLKPIVRGCRIDGGIEAFIGPALIPSRHPLAALPGPLSGIELSGRFVSNLFFSGPGAGPDVTAATILDDAVEAVTTAQRLPRRLKRPPQHVSITAPATGWLVRVRFPGVVPEASAARAAFTTHGLQVLDVTEPIDDARWLRLATTTREDVTRALSTLQHTHRIHAHAVRAL